MPLSGQALNEARVPTRLISRRNPVVYAVTKRIIAILFHALARVTVAQVGLIPRDGPFILACNHLSLLDGPFVLAHTPRPLHALAAVQYRRAPYGWLLRLLGAVFVHRERLDREALKQCLSILAAGGVLAVAVEGTRSPTRTLAGGKNGVAWLASRAGVPIVPVALHGTERIASALGRLRRADLELRFGAAIEPPGAPLTAAQLRDVTERLMHALADLLPSHYRGVYAPSSADADAAKSD